MTSNSIRAALATALLTLAPLAPALADDLPLVDRFVVFGDSLSDPGNRFIATRELSVRPYDLVPSAPYAIGRLHFSNGPTWVEDLAEVYDLRRSARPALLRPGVYTNYAFGLARAGGPDGAPLRLSNLSGQVGQFLDDHPPADPPEPDTHTLYILWIGSTDARDALESLRTDPTFETAKIIIGGAVGATAAAMQQLVGAGATSFLVLNLPDLGDTPAANAAGVEAAATSVTESYNEALEMALGPLVGNPGIDIVLFDVFGGFRALVDDPESAGFTNAVDSCITPGVFFGAICPQPDEYVFWDGIHPTEAAHAYLAKQVQMDVKDDFFIEAPVFARAHEWRSDRGTPAERGAWAAPRPRLD